MRRQLIWLVAVALLSGCGRGYEDDLFRAERGLWKIGKREPAVMSLPEDARPAACGELAQSYRELAEAIPVGFGENPPEGSLIGQLLRIRATAHMEEARWLVIAGRIEDAVGALREVTQSYAWDPHLAADAFRRRLLLLQRQGEPELYTEAVEEMIRTLDVPALGAEVPAELLQSFRTSSQLFRLAGDQDRASLQATLARTELQRLLEQGLGGTAFILVHTELALLALDDGKPAEAAKHYETAREAGRGTRWQPSLEFALANLYLGVLDEPRTAVGRFEELARGFPGSSLSARGLLLAGTALRTMGEFDDALRILTHADTLAERDRDLRASITFERAIVEEERGNWDRALALLRRVTADAPRTRVALNVPIRIASHHVARGDREGARPALRRAIRDYDELISSSDSRTALLALEMRSRAQILMEDWDGAIGTLLELSAVAPTSELAPMALAEGARLAEEKLNDGERSRQIWKKLLQDYPGGPSAALAAQRLRESGADASR